MTRILALAALALSALTAAPGLANDKLTVSVAAAFAWDGSPAIFGKRLGFFADAGIDLEIAATNTSSENLNAVLAGSADVGVLGVPVLIGAVVQGAPVKMFAGTAKGTADILWFVRADSPIQSFKDLKESNTVGVPSLGSTGYLALNGLLAQYGTKATAVAVGTNAAGLSQVMTGQLDVGTDGNGLLGIPEWNDGKIRIIAYGKEWEMMRPVTVRGLFATADTLANKRDVLVRFLKAWDRTIKWMYSDPQAIQWFAEQTQASLDEARRVVDNAYPEPQLQLSAVTGIDINVEQGLATKRIQRRPTPEELAKSFDMLWPPKP